MREIGERHNAAPAQIAAAWAIAKGTLPIIGITKVKQAEETARTANIALSAEEMTELERLAEKSNVKTLRGWEREM